MCKEFIKRILCTLSLLMFLFYGFATETVQKKVQNILNDKTIEDPYERYKIARDTAGKYVSHLPFDEAMALYNNIFLPFVEKKIKNVNDRNSSKVNIYSWIKHIYEVRGAPGDFENMLENEKKAVEFAELSGYKNMQAYSYHDYGLLLSMDGNIPLAHEYFYKAINLYELYDDFEGIFSCLYDIAENLLGARDAVGLRKVVEQMQQYIKNPKYNKAPRALYDYYSVQSAYYCILFEDTGITAYNDSTLSAIRNALYLYENNKDKIGSVYIGFTYHNMSLAYRRAYPQQYDSIYYFLDKALEYRLVEKMLDYELVICVYISYAELHFEQKRYAQAEKDMLYALSLLEEVQDDNTLAEYAEAYKFMVMYYETMKRPEEALKYHKLLLEVEAKRSDRDKITTMTDMLVKYETEQKKEHIDRLTEQNQTARKILILIISLLVVLLVGVFILIRLLKLRKKNFELTIYETVLMAELKQTEQEQTLKEKELLQQQYQDLQARADQNQQQAQLYDTELKQIKQQMEQRLIQSMIEKLSEWISESSIERAKRNNYLQQLSTLDIDVLEQGYLTATEKISKMDMKYIICFAINMEVKDMSLLFNVEASSIRTVRYRIRKKFGDKNSFKFLM